MYKLLICLSALAICLNVLPVAAKAGTGRTIFGDTTKAVIGRSIIEPIIGVSLITDIARTHTETTAAELTLGRSLLLISTNPRTGVFAVYIS